MLATLDDVEDEAPTQLTLSLFQQRVAVIPDALDLLLAGGRGGGKSFGLAFLQARHAEQAGRRAKMLFVRQNYRGMRDFEAIQEEVFRSVFGKGARYNGQDHFWTFPNGATLQNDQFEARADYGKYHGKSFSLISVDEAGEYSDPALLDLLRSCLRAPKPITPRFVMIANPGGAGHAWLSKRHVFKAPPWTEYTEPATGRRFVNCPSVYTDNPHIDHADYREQLEGATSTDHELRRAWINADWSVSRGAYFSTVLDQDRVMVDGWDPPSDRPNPIIGDEYFVHHRATGEVFKLGRRVPRGHNFQTEPFRYFLAHDFGSSSPSVTYVCAESPGTHGPDGRFYPRRSIILLDELATVEPGSLNKGLGYTIPHLAEAIVELAKRWRMKAEGVGDDSMFSFGGSAAGSYAAEFKANGVTFHPAQKGRRKPGWALMRTMLQDAGKPDRPGLYVHRRCEYWWTTVPSLGRDPRDTDDVDSRGPDHAADACRYALTREVRISRTNAVGGGH